MAYSSEQFFTDEAIRDTVMITSSSTYAGAFIPKTILFKNTLDAAVDIEIFGCSKDDQATHYQINAATITIPANTNTFETLEDYFQCFSAFHGSHL